MAIKVEYDLIPWEDAPSTATPINAENLNKQQTKIKEIIDELHELDEAKLGKEEVPNVPVKSVNGKTGAVSLGKTDIGLGNVDNVKQYSASNPPPYPVTSVNGKTGAVTVSVPTKTSQLTNDSNFVTKSVTDALSGQIDAQQTQVTTNKNDIVGIQKELDALVSAKAEGSTLEEQLAWLEAHGDKSKEYFLLDGFYYKCVYKEGGPLYTNLLPLATDTDRKTIFNGTGYKSGFRLNSSGVQTSASNYQVTGFIPCKKGDLIRILGAVDGQTVSGGSYSHNLCFYDASNTFLGLAQTTSFMPNTFGTGWNYVTQSDGRILITVDTSQSGLAGLNNKDISNCNAFRFMAGDFSNAIITVNEEIVEGTSEGTYEWVNTGRTTAGTNYEDRIARLEETVEEMSEQIENGLSSDEKTYNNPIIKAVAHRGCSTVAPENTLSAYRLAKKMGFEYVETDVTYTSDGVAVLLHDDTVDRTSNGTGNIADLTFEQVRALDFGSWKSSEYTGEKIPTFEEFLVLCKNLGLHPSIELKQSGSFTQENIASLHGTVKRYGMRNHVSWVSSNQTFLEYVKNVDANAELGLIRTGISENTIATATALRTETNNVFLSIEISTLTEEAINRAVTNDFEIEAWSTDATTIPTLDPYITRYVSDYDLANKVLYDASI